MWGSGFRKAQLEVHEESATSIRMVYPPVSRFDSERTGGLRARRRRLVESDLPIVNGRHRRVAGHSKEPTTHRRVARGDGATRPRRRSDRISPRTFALAMMVWVALLLAAVLARAQDAHGAIAFGHITQDQAVAYGFAWDYPARDEAEDAALNVCLSASGGSDCTVLAWFQNGCGALAVDQYGMAQGKGARALEQAEARALATCEAAGGVGCAVMGSLCVSAGGEPDTWSGSESVLAKPEEEPVPTADLSQDEELTREERMRVQQGLAALGFDAGPADGMFGPRTRSAIGEWQQAKGLETTGYLSRDEAEVLAAAGAESQEQPASPGTTELDGPRNQVLYFMPEGPKCVELGSNLSDVGCWEEVPSQPGCYIWAPNYPSYRIEDWTGGCAGYTAHGRGSVSSTSSEYSNVSGTGSVEYGKKDGHWVWRYANGDVAEGPYIDGEWHGHWVWRYANGTVAEGPYVDGERHGHWVWRYASGDVHEGPYVDGKRHGHWVERWSDGGSSEGPYVDGKTHGHWVIRYANGQVREGPFVAGDKHGRWVTRFLSGNVLETEWRNGSREGQSGVYQTANGTRHPGRWSDGCFRDADGYAWVSGDGKTVEECRSR